MKRQIMNAMNPFIRPFTKSVLRKYYNDHLEPISLTEQHVLVLAPHVDDETIGLGGTLGLYKGSGTEVHVCYMTDGAKSVSDLDGQNLAKIRREEAKQVQDFFKIRNLYFLDQPDGEVTSNPDVQANVLDLINDIQPDVIYVTPYVDCHNDHIATAEILADALKQTDQQPIIRAYEINTAIPKGYINTVVDITSTFNEKTKAIDIFQSQAIDFDGLIKMSEYKQSIQKNNRIKYVETFRSFTKNEWIEAVENAEDKYQYHQHLKQMNKEVTLLYAHLKNKTYKENIYKNSVAQNDAHKGRVHS